MKKSLRLALEYNSDVAFTDETGDQITATSYVTLQKNSQDVVLDMTGIIGNKVVVNVLVKAIAAAGTEQYWIKIDDGDASDFSGKVQSTEFEVDKSTPLGLLEQRPEFVVKNGYIRVQSKVANSGDWTLMAWLSSIE